MLGKPEDTEKEGAARALDARAPAASVTFPNKTSRRVFVAWLGWTDLRWTRAWVGIGPASRAVGVDEIELIGCDINQLWRGTARGS